MTPRCVSARPILAVVGLQALAGGCEPERRWAPEVVLAPTLARMDADHDGRVSTDEYERVRFHAPAFDAVDTDDDGTLSHAEVLDLIQTQSPSDFYYPSIRKARPKAPGEGGAGRSERLPGVATGSSPDGAELAPYRDERRGADGAGRGAGRSGPGEGGGPGPGAGRGPGIGVGEAKVDGLSIGPADGSPGAGPGPARSGARAPGEHPVAQRALRATGDRAKELLVERVILTLCAEISAVQADAPLPSPEARAAAVSSRALDSDASKLVLAELESTSYRLGLDFPGPLRAEALTPAAP